LFSHINIKISNLFLMSHRSILFSVTVILLGSLLLVACRPVIYRFTVSPLTIGSDDSIRTDWQVRGEAILLIHDRKLTGADSNARLRELTLVVRKNGREISRKIQVAVLPNGITERIVFRTVLQGDTLVAEGTNNALRWGDDFVIRIVTDATDRPLDIRHNGITRHLEQGSPPAANEMIAQQPGGVQVKYPELYQWQAAVTQART
jgi:hypothetical protein